MLVFVIEHSVVRVITEYIDHVKSYLKKHFDIDSHLVIYGRGITIVPNDKWDDVVFIQRINVGIYNQLKNIKPFKPRKIFLLNTEQTTHIGYTKVTLRDIEKYHPYVIDYSLENIHILSAKIPKTSFIHFPYPFTPIKPLPQKTNQVVMLANSQDRNKTLSKIQAAGFKIQNFNNKWAKDRDNIIRNSKILVNIHYALPNYNILETIRCYGALEQCTIVISEPSIIGDKVLLKDYIVTSSREEIDKTVKTILENYDLIYNHIFNDDQIGRLEKLILDSYIKSIEQIKKLPNNL